MEPRFGHDFSAVRVHSDTAAAASAHDLGAAAYTLGQHIVFGADRYRPETPAGGRLLAHELTHVVQGAVAGTGHLPLVSDPEDSAEREADAVASRFGRCDSAPPVSGRPAALIHRAPEIWFRGEAVGVPPARASGVLHDFGDGLYLTDSPGVAEEYAVTRAGDKPLTARLRSVAIEPERLGRVLDLTQDIRWQTFLKSHPTPLSPTNEELIRQANENYSRLFDEFVRINKIPVQEYDAIKGPEFVRGGTQICIRNPQIQAEVRAALTDLPMSTPGAPGGEVPAPTGVSKAAVTPAVEPGTVPQAPAPTMTTPEVAPPVEEPPVAVAGTVLGGIVKNAIFIAIGLIIQWGLSKLIQAAVEADITETLKEQLPQKLDKLKPKLDALRGKGDVFIWISYDYYYQRTPDPIIASMNPPFYEPGSVTNVGVHPGNEEINAEPSHQEYPEKISPERERVKVQNGFRVLLDNSFSKAQARARRERLQTSQQSPLQRLAPGTPQPASPAAPAPSPLHAPGPAPLQSFTPLPGAPGPSPLQEAIDKVRVARSMTEALLSRGEALEQRLGSGNPPSPEERKAFATDEEQWRLFATRAWDEYFKHNPNDEARAAFDELLHSEKYGGRLAQIHEHLGE